MTSLMPLPSSRSHAYVAWNDSPAASLILRWTHSWTLPKLVCSVNERGRGQVDGKEQR